MKKSPERDPMFVGHILDAIENIEEFIREVDFESFSQDKLRIDAVVREIEIIGEAARNLSDEFRTNNPGIPLYEAIGMRNRIVHVYWEVILPLVWSTCKNDLPELKEELLKIK